MVVATLAPTASMAGGVAVALHLAAAAARMVGGAAAAAQMVGGAAALMLRTAAVATTPTVRPLRARLWLRLEEPKEPGVTTSTLLLLLCLPLPLSTRAAHPHGLGLGFVEEEPCVSLCSSFLLFIGLSPPPSTVVGWPVALSLYLGLGLPHRLWLWLVKQAKESCVSSCISIC